MNCEDILTYLTRVVVYCSADIAWVETQCIIRNLQNGNEGEEWAEIAAVCNNEAAQLFVDAAYQEMDWAKYLFKDGAMLGLNEKILVDYVKYLAYNRMEAVGLISPFEKIDNPIPWITTWFSSDSVQVVANLQSDFNYIC